jgi:FixJ family two-component response regulator
MASSFVYVIDDDASMRASLESLLTSVGHQVETVASVQAFMDSPRAEAPSCLVLDVRLPGRSGLELQRDLSSAGVLLPIVFITGHGDIPMSVAAMKAGAIEFLTKPFRDQDLLDAVHRGLALDRQHREESSATSKIRERFNALTPREREIMGLVVAGKLNKQIAGELHVSEITVIVHRAQMMQKMQAGSLADMVRFSDKLAL